MTPTDLHDTITDVPGLAVGHFTHADRATGCTVILCPQGAVAGVRDHAVGIDRKILGGLLAERATQIGHHIRAALAAVGADDRHAGYRCLRRQFGG